MRLVLLLVASLIAAAAGPARGQAVDLDRIIEIKGYPPPPDVGSPSPRRVNPRPVDIRGAELRTFLRDYVYVDNEHVVAKGFSSADAIAVFGDGNRPITFMYAACPWEVASIGMIRGRPHLIVFVVNADFVIFQLRNLCADPPPGFRRD